MLTSDILTDAEIDAFAVKLKATAAAAAQVQAIMRVVAGLATTPRSKETPPQPPTRSATKRTAKSIPPPTTQQARSKASAKRARAGGKRRPGLVPAIVLAVLVGAKDGLALGAIADKLGGAKEKGRVAAALRKLRDEGKAKVAGAKRAAKWFVA